MDKLTGLEQTAAQLLLTHCGFAHHDTDAFSIVPAAVRSVEFANVFALWLRLRKEQFGETLTNETRWLWVLFAAGEPDPVAVVERACNRGQRAFKSLFCLDNAHLAVPPRFRYAQRTSRAKRNNPDRITDTVFAPRHAWPAAYRQGKEAA